MSALRDAAESGAPTALLDGWHMPDALHSPWRRGAVAGLALVLALGAALAPLACSRGRDATAPFVPPAECALAGPPATGSTQAYVAIRHFAFSPDTLHIPAGTTVTWVNCETPDIDAHTATATGGEWDSGYLASGKRYSRVFAAVGRFPYSCIPHPTMRGAIVVE